ncbi:hypothetical protein CHLNCDRAFT_48888 [Chlorella variabilis]|uniref:MEMO1 family protein n=1 Tax=Chlorella variabilis TaxID=554065 RepID=E1ZGY9_CHLVA|nr:hypothetical protein CHLNCDRAFT_48888 [Chlorella variabilis]EFN54834.1 hypothetical protein CHLNCDRAFT_48888 [Chlorella variabilis]|eukprot:XP_005846936.1 hypothetical protein CHLNCDRAFT_48888 [Chlorella variabilis]
MPRIRATTHAGTWYSNQAGQLQQQLKTWLSEAEAVEGQHARAIIAPHAGYRYSGHVAAYAYKQIDPTQVRRVFLLGPSHHFYSKHCLLSPADAYATPLGSATIDAEVYAELRATGKFQELKAAADEAEHSLELHLPYIVHMMAGRPFTLVPIVVGAISAESEAAYGRLLAPYLDDSSNLFIVSSDFCHWGKRFSYTFYDPAQASAAGGGGQGRPGRGQQQQLSGGALLGPIHASIERLDRQGMALIEAQDAAGFTAYLKQHGNTICGRHPTALLLHALRHCATKHSVRFTKYDQSHRCTTEQDSSVSYASAVVVALGR